MPTGVLFAQSLRAWALVRDAVVIRHQKQIDLTSEPAILKPSATWTAHVSLEKGHMTLSVQVPSSKVLDSCRTDSQSISIGDLYTLNVTPRSPKHKP